MAKKTIKFKGVSRKGKALIETFGQIWRIHETMEEVPMLDNARGMLVSPKKLVEGEPQMRRWVKFNGQPLFTTLV